MDRTGDDLAPIVLDGETLRRVNEQHGYRYRQRQKYLQEDDRVEIIRRLLAGEKQSELAREFGVTRAAVCNTFKNRDEILARSRHVFDAQCARAAEARSTPEPETSRPRSVPVDIKREPEHTQNTPTYTAPGPLPLNDGRYPTMENPRRPRTTKKRSLEPERSQDEDADDPDFHRRDALHRQLRARGHANSTIFPARAADEVSTDESSLLGHRSLSRPSSPNERNDVMHRPALPWAPQFRECTSPSVRSLVVRLRDPATPPGQFRTLADRLIRLLLKQVSVSRSCARDVHPKTCEGRVVAVGISNGGYPLLRSYQNLHPDEAVGLIRFDADATATNAAEVSLPYAAPSACSILLMTSESTSGATVCRAIEELLMHGIDESSIQIVAVFLGHRAIARLRHLFPAVNGVIAAVGEPVDAQGARDRLSDQYGFLDRYYHADGVIDFE